MTRPSAVALVVFFFVLGLRGNAGAAQLASAPLGAVEADNPVGAKDTEASNAPETPQVAMGPAHRVSFVISGGVSLGMYEAGLLWTFLQASRVMRGAEWEAEFPSGSALDVSGFYGASAGGINAVLGAIQSCLVEPGSAESNLLQTVWLGVGVENLLPLHGTSSDGEKYGQGDHLLSRRAFDESIRLIEETLKGSVFIPNCKRHVVLLVTRTHPSFVAHGGVEIPTQRVVIPLVFETDSDGRPSWKVDATVLKLEKSKRGDALRLRESDNGRVPPRDVLDSMLATSAFPGAFSPMVLDHCVNAAEIVTSYRCDASESLGCPTGTRRCQAEFLDGGVFDNIPLGLAAEHQMVLNDWKTSQPWIVYVDPDIRRGRPRTAPPVAKDAGIDRLAEIVFGVVETGRKHELEMQARRWIDAPSSTFPASRILVSSRRAPLTASLFKNFGAFLSRSFRSHDYAVGVFDALWQLAYRQCQVQAIPVAAEPAQVPKESCVSERLAWWQARILADSPVVSRWVNRLAALELEGEIGLSVVPWSVVKPDEGPSRKELLACAEDLGPVLDVRGKNKNISVLDNPLFRSDRVENRYAGAGSDELEVMTALTARISPCQENGKWQKANATMSACIQEPDFSEVVRRLACQLHAFESDVLFSMALRELTGRSALTATVPAMVQRQLKVEGDALERARSDEQATDPDGGSSKKELDADSWPGRLRLAGYLLSEPSLYEPPRDLAASAFSALFRFSLCSGTSIPQGDGYLYCFLPSRLEFDPLRGGVRVGYDWGFRRGEASGLSIGGSLFVVDWRPASFAGGGGFGTGARAEVQFAIGNWYVGPSYSWRGEAGWGLFAVGSNQSITLSLDFMRKASLNVGGRLSPARGFELSVAVSDLSGLAYWLTL